MAIKLGAKYRVTLLGCEYQKGIATSYKQNINGSNEVWLSPATGGPYGNQIMSELTAMDALSRWSNDHWGWK